VTQVTKVQHLNDGFNVSHLLSQPKTAATCLYLYSALAGIVSNLDTYTDLGAIIHDNQGHDLPFLRSMR
jgi:hypothetical protein